MLYERAWKYLTCNIQCRKIEGHWSYPSTSHDAISLGKLKTILEGLQCSRSMEWIDPSHNKNPTRLSHTLQRAKLLWSRSPAKPLLVGTSIILTSLIWSHSSDFSMSSTCDVQVSLWLNIMEACFHDPSKVTASYGHWNNWAHQVSVLSSIQCSFALAQMRC